MKQEEGPGLDPDQEDQRDQSGREVRVVRDHKVKVGIVHKVNLVEEKSTDEGGVNLIDREK